jgi:MFS family permease
MEGVADTVASLLKLWSGAWSDRAGQRKGFVVIGYTLAAVARPLVGVASASWQVFAIRTTDRIGKGIRTAPRDALIAESTPAEIRGRAFGFHRAMDHLGAAIGPLLGAAFLWAWPGQLRTMFLITLIPGLAVVGLVVWGLREPASHIASSEPLRLTLRPFDRNFRVYLLALVIFALGNSSDVFLLVRAGELGVPPATLPLLWCAFHVVKSVGNLLAGGAVDKLGSRPLIFGGWAVYTVIYIAFAFAASAWQVWILFLSYGLFYALTEPAEKTFVTALVGSERQGLAFGWFNFAIGIAALPSSVSFGWLYDVYGSRVAFGWGAGLACLAALILLGVKTPIQGDELNGKEEAVT